jgi:hypothetical protein
MLKRFCLACFLTLSVGAQVTAERPSFSEFPVKSIFRGKPATPKLVTKGQRMFRTRILAGAKSPVEFAGHYTLPRWGCGTLCNEFVIVDSVTGRVYDVPFSLSELPTPWEEEQAGDDSLNRMDYRPDSRLMKINACLNEQDCGFYDYVMVDGKGLQLVPKELLPPEFQPAQ